MIYCFFAFFFACAIVFFLGRPCIAFLHAKKVGQMIQSFEGFFLYSLHKDKKDTPTMGGILLLFATTVASIFFVPKLSSSYFVLLFSMFAFAAVGAVDDVRKLQSKSSKGLTARFRFTVETSIAVCIILYLHYFTPFDTTTFFFPFISSGITYGLFFLVLLQWFTLVGTANAVNLSDGLDGLAAGLSVITLVPLILFALFSAQNIEVAVFLSALAGACLGFLWFNAHPAKIFMGDTGSLAIGGALGTAAVFMNAEWFLALIGMMFVIETSSVIIQVIAFKTTKRRVFRCSPLHHHFEYGKLPEVLVVVRFWIVGILFSTIGIMALIWTK